MSPPKHPKKSRSRSNPAHSGRRRITAWRGFVDTANVGAHPDRLRFFKAETLQSSVERALDGRDTIFAPALESLASGMSRGSLAFELRFELSHVLVFTGAAAASGKRVSFRLVVAKDADARSLALRRTWKALKHAYDRSPEHTFRPLTSGYLYLPDRHRRADKDREIFCCLTELPPQSHPLVVAREGRFAELQKTPKLLRKDQELITQQQLIELVARCYDPKRQTGIILPTLDACQIEIVRIKTSTQLALALPDGLRTRLTVPRFLHELVSWTALGPGTSARVRPPEIELFHRALVHAVGAETAMNWLSRYKRSVEQRKLPPIPPLLPENLTTIGVE